MLLYETYLRIKWGFKRITSDWKKITELKIKYQILEEWNAELLSDTLQSFIFCLLIIKELPLLPLRQYSRIHTASHFDSFFGAFPTIFAWGQTTWTKGRKQDSHISCITTWLIGTPYLLSLLKLQHNWALSGHEISVIICISIRKTVSVEIVPWT